MSRTNDELDRLMARGGLGGAAREQILEGLLGAEAPPAPRPSRRRLWMGGLALAAAGAAALVFVVRPSKDEFRAKGAGAGLAELGLDCEQGSLSACPLGSTLMFRVSSVGSAAYLQAYAEPRDGGERVWYFSAENQAPRLAARANTQVVRQGVRLGPEHRPGRYRVHVVLSTTPLGRTALLAGSPSTQLSATVVELNVVPR
jgi:hypothetical protein